jgi:hypothetical protein
MMGGEDRGYSWPADSNPARRVEQQGRQEGVHM